MCAGGALASGPVSRRRSGGVSAQLRRGRARGARRAIIRATLRVRNAGEGRVGALRRGKRNALDVSHPEKGAHFAVRERELGRAALERHNEVRDRGDARDEHGDVVEGALLGLVRHGHDEEGERRREQDHESDGEGEDHGWQARRVRCVNTATCDLLRILGFESARLLRKTQDVTTSFRKGRVAFPALGASWRRGASGTATPRPGRRDAPGAGHAAAGGEPPAG